MWPFDSNNHQVYQQYAQAYDSGYYDNIDPNQAASHLQQFVQNAPPDMQQQIYQQHFSQLPYEQRAALAQHMPPHYNVDPNNPMSLAQGFMRLGQEQPNVLQRVFSHPLLLGCMVGLTGLVAKHVIEHHQRHSQGQQQAAYQQDYNQGNNNQGGYNQGGYNQGNNNQGGYNQGGNNQGGYNQGGYNQGGYNQGGNNQNVQQELNQERQEIQELQRELNQERQQEGQQHHHHRREEY